MTPQQSLILAVAIVAEVIATSSLTASQGFTRLVPSLLTIGGYAVAFVFLSFALKTMPTGIVYAIWSGVGIVLISIVGWLWFKQSLDLAAMVGMGLIVAGVVVINTFSRSVSH
jgi:small multidrug resistance pump